MRRTWLRALLGWASLGCSTAPDTPATALPMREDFQGESLDPAWTVLNGETFAFATVGGVLSMTPNRNTVWYHKDQGPGLVREVEGDFKISARVRARKASAPEQAVDRGFQFGGLIARDPASDGRFSSENYVFSVIGYRGSYLSAETKTTRNGESTVEGPPWPSGDAELRLCRRGENFMLYNRPYGETNAPWTMAIGYQRPDLPARLQVGMIAYTYTDDFDLVAQFEDLRLEAVTSLEDCLR